MKRRSIKSVLLLLLFAAIGVMFVRYSWIRIENEQLDSALQIARSIEATLTKQELNTLKEKPDDVNLPQYQAVKSTLRAVLRVNSEASATYINSLQNSKIYLLSESGQEGSHDYSKQNRNDLETNIIYHQPFKNGKEVVKKIVTDKGNVGTDEDILVDDHPHWNGADKFPGLVIPFNGPADWAKVIAEVESRIQKKSSMVKASRLLNRDLDAL